MKFAYCISAYVDSNQLCRLINSLHDDAHFFIHIDKKADFSAFKQLLVSKSNVHFVKSYKVKWATISQVEYQMLLLKTACDYPIHFDYIFMLSGFDYPVWSNKRISQYVKDNYGKEFICAIPINNSKYLHTLQTQIWPDINIPYSSFLSRAIRGSSRKLLKLLRICKEDSISLSQKKLSIYKGSDYFCISQALAKYVYEQYYGNPIYRKHFVNTFAPSETCIHTIVFNSQYSSKCFLIDDEYRGLKQLTLLHYLKIDGANVRVLSEIDLNEILSSDKMFARKFRTGISEELISKIENLRKKHD